MFFEENAKALREFSRLSKTAGSRADYVQGGGGNTSVKLAGGLMAIKASGFRLSDIEPDNAYAVLDGAAVRAFYDGHRPEDFEDVEKTGTETTKSLIKSIEGLAALRPSVEVGFHSLLDRYVLHTHSVYANLAACSGDCAGIAAKAFADADYSWGMVAYVDPGVRLTFAINEELRRVQAATGKRPAVILMQNHGVIAHSDDPDRCLAIHADANERLAAQFGVRADSFPEVKLSERGAGLYAAEVPYLKEKLAGGGYTQRDFLEYPLYPDQMVFLTGAFAMDRDTVEEGMCVANSQSGEVLLRMDAQRALVIAETLTAVVFIQEHIKAAGHALSTMAEEAQRFIANWESETYRKSLVSKK